MQRQLTQYKTKQQQNQDMVVVVVVAVGDLKQQKKPHQFLNLT